MQEGMQKQGQQGKKGQEEMSGEQFQLYQEQQMLREKLKDLLDQQGSGSKEGKKALDAMEELERLLLEKGMTEETLERMQELEYELLELENASLKKKKDNKREATTNVREFDARKEQEMLWKKLRGEEKELLRRENIRMNPEYQEKVKSYFEIKSDSVERGG